MEWGALAEAVAPSVLSYALGGNDRKTARDASKGQLELARGQLEMQRRQFNEVDFPMRKLAMALMAQRAERSVPRFLPGQRQANNPYRNRQAVQHQGPSPQPANGPPQQAGPPNLRQALMAARQQQRPQGQALGPRLGQSLLPGQ